jgi:hypothetical protein
MLFKRGVFVGIFIAVFSLFGTSTAGAQYASSCTQANYFNQAFHPGCVSWQDLNNSWASPPPIGNKAPNSATFTNLTVTGNFLAPAFSLPFASPPPMGNITPNTGAFSLLTASGNMTVGGTLGVTGAAALNTKLLIGSGTVSGLPFNFQVAQTVDPSTLASGNRYDMFNLVYNYSANTTNIMEGVTNFTYVHGPGQANGEINFFHGYLEIEANATVTFSDPFENSIYNYGVATKLVSFNSLMTNAAGGTVNTIYGISGALTNNNATVGSVGSAALVDCEAMEGTGSHPTYENCIRNANPNGWISSLGGIALGTLGSSPGNLLAIFGADDLDTSYPMIIKNGAPNFALTLAVANSGRFQFTAAGLTIEPTSLGAALNINGPDNSGSTYLTKMASQSTGIGFALSDTLVATFANNALVIQPASIGAILTIGGPDNSGSTFLASFKNLAGTSILAVSGAGVTLGGTITAGSSAGLTCTGTPSSSFATVNGIVTHC